MFSTPNNPLTSPESVLYHIKALARPESILTGLSVAIAAIINHLNGAPPMHKAFLLVASVAFVADMITGSLRASRIGGKYKGDASPGFNSRDFGSGIIKLAVYMTVICLCTAADLAFGLPYACATFALMAVATREVTSNFENCKVLMQRIREPWIFDRAEQNLFGMLTQMRQVDPVRTDEVVAKVCAPAAAPADEKPSTTPGEVNTPSDV